MNQRYRTTRHPVIRVLSKLGDMWEKHHWQAFIVTAVIVALVNCVVER